MLVYFQVPLTWTELLKRTARETQNDNGVGLAAQLAYYFFLALFPALLFLLALVSVLPLPDLPDRLAGYLASVAPPEVGTLIREQLAQLWQRGHGGLLTFGFLAALWSSSAALVALIDALNRVYDARGLAAVVETAAHGDLAHDRSRRLHHRVSHTRPRWA